MEIIESIEKSKDPRRIDLEGRILVAHQVEFMPWLGFISKAAMGDVYIIIDNSQFKKEYFENRNKIRVKSELGWTWLTVPINDKKRIRSINEYYISGEQWKKKHLRSIQVSYSRAPFFDKYFREIEELYNEFNSYLLVDLNVRLINYAFSKFGINVPQFRLTDLIQEGAKIEGKATDWVISICKAIKADVFVAGPSGKGYLDVQKFMKENIKLVFQKFTHPVYSQIHGNFIPNMSFIDILFNHGPESIQILGASNYELAEEAL